MFDDLSFMARRARGYADRAENHQQSMELGAIAITLDNAADRIAELEAKLRLAAELESNLRGDIDDLITRLDRAGKLDGVAKAEGSSGGSSG